MKEILTFEKRVLHTYYRPHWFYQPTKSVSWDVSANQHKLNLRQKKFQQQCQMRQIKVLTQGRVCGKTLLLVQIAFLLLPEHQRPKKISQRTIGKKSSSRFSQVHCFANVNSRGIYHYAGRRSVYYVRLKACNFRDDSWTKRKREWNLLVIRAREAA